MREREGVDDRWEEEGEVVVRWWARRRKGCVQRWRMSAWEPKVRKMIGPAGWERMAAVSA